MKNNNKKAFTLAETLIVLVILGTIAAIVVPALIRNHVENANRTKLKKCMTVYDTALSKMVIENNIKSPNDLNTFGQTGTCDNTRPYFKSVQDGFDNCTFRTADGMWWNISEIDKPLISFNEITQDNIEDIRANAADTANHSAFYLYAWFDNNGNLRVDDPQAALTDATKTYLQALYDYVNGKKTKAEIKNPSPFDECTTRGATECTVNGVTYKPKTWEGQCINLSNGKQSCSESGIYWVSEPVSWFTYSQYSDVDSSMCTDCKENDWEDTYNSAKRYCNAQGGKLPTVAELISMQYTGFSWASEEYDQNRAYSVMEIEDPNDSSPTEKYSYSGNTICIIK